MVTTAETKIQKGAEGVLNKRLTELKIKASILDELVGLIEDRYLGYLMHLTEKEKNIPLKKARKILR